MNKITEIVVFSKTIKKKIYIPGNKKYNENNILRCVHIYCMRVYPWVHYK